MTSSLVETTSTATLLCNEQFHENGSSDLLVMGIEVTGDPNLLVRADINRARIQEMELQWPTPMIERLADFYDRVYVYGSEKEWNCHSFGAHVTANTDQLEQNENWMVTNALKGQQLMSDEVENARYYGIFTQLGYLSHTLVGTQIKGTCINVIGYCSPLSYSRITDMQNTYKGTVHTYGYRL